MEPEISPLPYLADNVVGSGLAALEEIKAIHYCIKMLRDRITLDKSDGVSGKNTI